MDQEPDLDEGPCTADTNASEGYKLAIHFQLRPPSGIGNDAAK
jgi:hypothetical protein